MDLQNKYQILASEFSKVRGQVTVLKKAVLDEQSKSQQLQVNHFINYSIDKYLSSRKILIKKIKI
jgi:hypothetical protein